MNSHLGLALKVLAEEDDGAGSPVVKKKSQFFESTFEQIRQQKQGLRLGQFSVREEPAQKLPTATHDSSDSGIATPLSPSNISSASSSNKSETSESEPESLQSEHPLSNGVDFSVRFNGTTQLKSLRGGGGGGKVAVVKS